VKYAHDAFCSRQEQAIVAKADVQITKKITVLQAGKRLRPCANAFRASIAKIVQAVDGHCTLTNTWSRRICMR
jgi:hypothetical protein